MRMACGATELAAGLAVVSRALAPRTAMPVLGAILLEARADGLWLTATNLELEIRRRVVAEVAAEGAVAVPGRLLAEFTSAIPGEALEVEVRPSTAVLRLRSQSFETDINGMEAAEFPPRASIGQGCRLCVAVEQLIQAISDTVGAASTDEARPLLTGVSMRVDGNRMTLTAMDGYRIAEQSVRVSSAAADSQMLAVTVPARSLAEVARIFRGLGGQVEVTVASAGNGVFFRTPDVEISSRVIDGTYPDTDRVVPTTWATSATVETDELNRRLRALLPFAQQGANAIHLAITPASLVVSAASDEVGSARTELAAQVSGPECAIAFNGRYLVDCATAASQRIELRLAGPLAPVVVKRPGMDDYLYLFMPIRPSL